MSLSRRQLLASAACGSVATLPTDALASASLLGKLPWESFIGAASLALQLWNQFIGGGSSGAAPTSTQPPVCSLSYQYLGELISAHEQVAWALLANRRGPVLQGGDRGVIASLEEFLASRDPNDWPRIRADAVRLLNAIERLLTLCARENGVLSLIEASTRSRTRAALEHGLQGIGPGLALLQLDERPPSDLDVREASRLLDQLRALPPLASNALTNWRRQGEIRTRDCRS